MKLKPIPYQSGFVFVDTEIIFNNGDKLTHLKTGERHTFLRWQGSMMVTEYETEIGKAEDWTEKSLGYFKEQIIAQHNLNIEGIPHVDVGEDVEQISFSIQQRAADKLNRGQKPYIASKMYVDYLNTIIDGFKSALSKANKKEFTREQVHKMLCEFALYYHTSLIKDIANDASEYIDDWCILSKIESIEPETVRSTYYSKEDKLFQTSEYITYQRDGKTYIKCKINYDTKS